MKKILTTLGLISLTGVTIANISTSSTSSTQNKQEINTLTQINSVDWHFKEGTLSSLITSNGYMNFAININLTSIGIKGIDELHKYNVINVPGLQIEYEGTLAINGDTWMPKNRHLGTENWYHQYSGEVGPSSRYQADLYTAATLQYDSYGNFIMSLGYRAYLNCFNLTWNNLGRVTIRSGSIVQFY